MPSLEPTARGGWKARKRIPKDVAEEHGRLHGARFEAKLTLPPGTKKPEALKRYGEWLAEVEGNVGAIRAARTGTGISLTAREAATLSGEWYKWFTSRHDKDGKSEWEQRLNAVQGGIWSAVSERDAHREDPDELWEERASVRQAVRPILADVGQTAQFLAIKKIALNNQARDLFLDNLYADLRRAASRPVRHA